MAPARRNPKRKNTGALGNRPVPIVQPTQAQIDKAFEEAVDKMAKGGVWGDNPEIYAFAHAYNVSVQVYSEIGGFFVAIEGSVSPHPERQTVWIVFHVSALLLEILPVEPADPKARTSHISLPSAILMAHTLDFPAFPLRR